jgi:hypothetical protein
LLIGSFDTTAASILQFLLQMCRHPGIALKAHDEIPSILGDSTGTGTGNLAGNLIFLFYETSS